MAGATLYKLSSGVILREDWQNPVGWSGSSPKFSVGFNSGFVSFGTTPMVAFAPLPGTGDAGGVRECQILVEGDQWDLFYAAGDGSTASTGNWKPQLAISNDGGVTWKRRGFVLGSDGLATGGAETTLTYRDFGFVMKINGNYVLFSLYGYSVIQPDNHNGYIPSTPYTCDCWYASSVYGPWTFSTQTPTPGGVGSIDEKAAQSSSIVSDGTTLWNFYTMSPSPYNLNNINVGLASAAVGGHDAGPWTKVGGGGAGAPILPAAGANSNAVENPKVWYWPQIGKWVLTINGRSARTPGSSTPQNFYYLNSSLTDWSTPVEGPYIFQHCDGASTDQVVLDGVNNVGIITPFMQDGSVPVIDSNGYIPAIYDTGGDARWDSATQNDHVGRHLAYTVLEPSPACLSYAWTAGNDVANRYQKSVSHGDFYAEFAMDYSAANNAGYVGMGLDYRIQASGDSYRLLLPAGTGPSGLQIHKSTGGSGGNPGTYTQLAMSSGNMLGYVNQACRVRMSVVGNVHTFWMDGEQQIAYTDSSSPYTSGVAVAFFAGGMTARFRMFHMLSGSSVTIQGLESGKQIVVRAPGYIPCEVSTTSGTVYQTSSVVHYPVDTITYDGIDHSFTSAGLIWGGDVLSFPQAPQGFTRPSYGWEGLSRKT